MAECSSADREAGLLCHASRLLCTCLVAGLLAAACVSSSDNTPSGDSTGSNGCPVGDCNSNGFCCPADMPYGCKDVCYPDYNSGLAAGCSTYKTVC